ncbi:6033_t:CDS:10 [Ambispora leptoticha]|uniref:6033_t:CDS:1 n=1 Tax=Ambispora leptoticha TaxID=144679 RepID=A0A9N9BY80_9GLOM|nr:6033_t:CDS:10 [Ambispora leptoticha]
MEFFFLSNIQSAAILLIFTILIKFIQERRRKKFATSYKIPLIGHTLDFLYDTENFLDRCHNECGDIFSIYVFGQVTTIVAKSAAYEIFTTDQVTGAEAFDRKLHIREVFEKPVPQYLDRIADLVKQDFTPYMPDAIALISREIESTLRKYIGDCKEPKFFPRPFRLVQKILAELVALVFFGEELGRDPDLIYVIANVTIDLRERDKLLSTAKINDNDSYVNSRFCSFGESPVKKHKSILIERIKHAIDECVKDAANGTNKNAPIDLIRALVRQLNITEENKDYDLIASNILLVILVSISNTAVTITECLFDYAGHPEYWDEITKERETLLGANYSNNNFPVFNSEMLGKMERLDSFIRESMRQKEHLLLLPRKVVVDRFIFSNGYQIPKGRQVQIYAKSIRLDESLHGTPLEFTGFRYVGKKSSSTKITRDIYHFGLGRHACPGRFFAVDVMKVVVSGILARYHVTTESGVRPRPVMNLGFASASHEALVFERDYLLCSTVKNNTFLDHNKKKAHILVCSLLITPNSYFPNFTAGLLTILLSNIVVNNATLFPTSPDGNSIFKPGDQIEITWKDDPRAPSLSTLGSIKVDFMTGGDLQQIMLSTIGTVPGADGKITFTIPTVEPAGKSKYPPPPNPPPPVGKNPGGNGKIVSDVTNNTSANSSANQSAGNSSAANSTDVVVHTMSTNTTATNSNSTGSNSTSSSTTTHSAAPNGFQVPELIIALATLLITTTCYLL